MRMLRDLLDLRQLPSGTPERVFISRQDAARRRLVNETELADVLARGGFVPVRMSALDAPTQIATLARARHVVAPHGMGLAALAFNEGGESLIEIFNERIGTDAYAFIARAGTRVPIQHGCQPGPRHARLRRRYRAGHGAGVSAFPFPFAAPARYDARPLTHRRDE
jgi:acyl-CoA reductase-like NAD-dependent aldehyde dehydrogenase